MLDMMNGPEVGDAEVYDVSPDIKLVEAVDELLPDDFEMWELEGDESVYFGCIDREEEAAAEIRPTSPREQGYSQGVTPQYALTLTFAGPDADNFTTWFDLEKAIAFATKRIRTSLGIQ